MACTAAGRDGGDDKVRSMGIVSAREHFGMARSSVFIHLDKAALVGSNAQKLEPVRLGCLLTKGDDGGLAGAYLVGSAIARRKGDSLDLLLTDEREGLLMEGQAHTFFPGGGNLFRPCPHLLPTAAG